MTTFSMTKLTVYFKDHAIQTGSFEKESIRIGRNETNDITIDSLAVAPFHAVILFQDDGCTIKKITDDSLLMLNGTSITQSSIKNGDTIYMGKHKIVFNTAEAETQFFPHNTSRSIKQDADNHVVDRSLPAGSFQILDGNNIGKIIPIKKGITPIGHNGHGIVAVTKRKNGFFISILENVGTITLNEAPLNDASIKLNHNDVLVINNRSLQFFISNS